MTTDSKAERRRRNLLLGLRNMREDSKQFEDQMKRINNLEDTGRISTRKHRGVIADGGNRTKEHRRTRQTVS